MRPRRRTIARTVEVEFHGLSFGGDAVGRLADGKVVFAPFGAPGDRAEVEIRRDKKREAHGRILRILAPAPSRVSAPCPVFGRCGGCQWQHVAYPAQVAGKEALVGRSLDGLGGRVEPMRGAPAAYRYRTRAVLHATGGPRPRLGYRAASSHDLVDVGSDCPILAERVAAAIPILRERVLSVLVGRADLAVGCGRSAAVLRIEAERAQERPLYAACEAAVAERAFDGIVLQEKGGRTAARFGEPDEVHRGPDGLPLAIPAGGFAQANPDVARVLGETLMAWTDPRATVELHAGAGTWTVLLAARGPVRAFERDPKLAAACRKNIEARGLFAAVESADAERGAAAAKPSDLVVLDPPRTGAPEVVDLLARTRPAQVAYVSCDPMTAARDLRRLAGAGYRLERATSFDMMPQTSQVEMLAVLRLSDRHGAR